MYKRSMLLALLAAAGLFSFGSASAAEAWPTKPIRFVVPFTAGGAADILGRIVGQQLSLKYGQPVLVDNRPGASGHVGAEQVAKSAPDGYTIVLGTTGVHAAYTMYPKLNYDPSKALQVVSIIGEFPNLLVVNPAVPAQNMKEFLALAKAKPGELFFGSAGNGSSTHLSTELLKQVAGIDLKHVPYRGSSAAMNDLMGGQIQLMVENLPAVLPMVQSGRVRALAITSKTRSDVMPGIPTVAESGVPGYQFTAWFTVAVPAGTPQSIAKKLNADIDAIVHSPELAAKWKELGVNPIGGTLDADTAFISSEKKKFTALIQEAHLTADD
ncbi:tripartite tricarboxylate transporter substrate binding protein [Xylophilus rhododendri]|uniref:Tripartite tricarboxylate transporter substrate binding protein n=1 Tax=Xylophilus rhododendri TaxID=2697032 RepID=A0A857J494_9BURK|nr:tripartite tricarboxylate transporter substrate binding protein [Xylophilus rhododendri]QHI97688.1 tripartite tricarboxylate transporter substrate binding protein [Xylophilus rhododendri]